MDYQITNVHIAKVWHLLLVITNTTVPENSSRCSKQHLWRICFNTQVIYSIYIYIQIHIHSDYSQYQQRHKYFYRPVHKIMKLITLLPLSIKTINSCVFLHKAST